MTRRTRGGGAPAAAAWVAAAGLLPFAPAAADAELDGHALEGWLEVGGRTAWGDDGAGRFQDYRDPGDGVIGNFDLRLESPDGTRYLRGAGEHLGYDDQRYRVEGGRYGRFRLDLFYGELPRSFSNDARSFYGRSGNEFTLGPGVQSAIETAPSPAAELRTRLNGAGPTSLGPSWREGGIGAEWWAHEGALLRASYRIQDKGGERPFGIGFGTPGGNFITLPAPVDERIHEIRAGTDLALGACQLSFDYTGSLFYNDVDSVIGANPLVAVDADGAAGRGRSSTAPDNSAHTWSVSGVGSLPLGVPNRIASTLSYGLRLQDEQFLPHTVNSELTSTGLMLPANDLDGRVHTWLGNLVATARPLDDVRVELRGRVYDYDNRSDRLTFAEHVENDTEIVSTPRTSVRSDFRKVDVDGGASWDLSRSWTAGLGLGWEHWRRSDDREVTSLNEWGPEATLDYRTPSGLLLQASYGFRTRWGSDYGTFDALQATEALPADPDARASREALGQSPRLRKYDEADRQRHRVALLSRYRISESAEVTLTGGVDYARYPDSPLGLQGSLGWDLALDAGWRLHERVAVAGFYGYSYERFEQDELWRPRSFAPAGPPANSFSVVDDPLNLWSSKTRNAYHDAGVQLDVSVVPERLSLELAWLIHSGRAKTRSSAVPGLAAAPFPTVPGDGGAAVNWPEVTTLLNALTATLSLEMSDRITLRTQYRFEDYRLEDFRRPVDLCLSGAAPGTCGSTDVLLGDPVDDYTAHVMGFSVELRL